MKFGGPPKGVGGGGGGGHVLYISRQYKLRLDQFIQIYIEHSLEEPSRTQGLCIYVNIQVTTGLHSYQEYTL